jgi:hypothetical protein
MLATPKSKHVSKVTHLKIFNQFMRVATKITSINNLSSSFQKQKLQKEPFVSYLHF